MTEPQMTPEQIITDDLASIGIERTPEESLAIINAVLRRHDEAASHIYADTHRALRTCIHELNEIMEQFDDY
jgi:hypothetical protein